MERESGRSRGWILTVILLLVGAALLISAGIVLLLQNRAPLPEWPDVEGQDAAAEEIPLSLKDRLFGITQNGAGQFSYSVRAEVTIDTETGEGVFEFQNPPENRYLMAVEVTLAGEDTVLFRSGYLKPNEERKSARLTPVPAAGSYSATVYFYAVDFDTLDLCGILEQEIKLIVK